MYKWRCGYLSGGCNPVVVRRLGLSAVRGDTQGDLAFVITQTTLHAGHRGTRMLAQPI